MGFVKAFQTFRSGDDGHELDVPSAVFLDEIHGCDGRTACSQHGIGYHDGSLLNGVRKLAVVLVRLVCDFVAVKTDVTDFGRRNESSIPFTMPRPARRIGTMASFFPAIMGVIQVSIGVSTSTSFKGRSL